MQPLLTAIDLRTADLFEPLGIDQSRPRLSWRLSGGGRDAAQSAWRIRVGRSADGDAWDSGWRTGAEQSAAYEGSPLASRTAYRWQVQVRDGAGEGPWSAPARFETAYLAAADFAGAWLSASAQGDDERGPLTGARWVRPAQRGEMMAVAVAVDLASAPVHARLHVFAEGHDQPWACGVYRFLAVNGVLTDAAGNLPRRSVMSFDLAHLLRTGANRIAVRGFDHGDSAICAVVEIACADGGRQRIATGDPRWTTRAFTAKGSDGVWQDPAAAWSSGVDAGAFGAGPWPADDLRNRADRLIPALVLRRTITIDRPLARARIYATACGVYELRIDGRPVGDRVLAPGWTDYRKRVHYQTCDATALLAPGTHVLEATVADGWYAGHLATPFGESWYGTAKALKLALHLDGADGSQQVITTADSGWQAGTGPVRRADLMDGQVTDLTRETGDWRAPVAVPGPAGTLQAQPDQPVRRLMELPARSIAMTAPGRYTVDFGQNLVGAVRLRLRGPRGTRIRIRHAEVLDLKGLVWTENLRSALAVDEHILSGGDDDILPAFTFHGFRYAEIACPFAPSIDGISAVVYGSDHADTGTFTCDDPLLNRLSANIRWGQRGNFLSIPTDCPQRDERLGWTADTQVFVRTAAHFSDTAAFYRKWIDDLVDAQHPDGAFPDYAPANDACDKGRFGWACAGIIVPWWLWRIYGDLDTARRVFPAMRRYLDQRDRTAAADGCNRDWSFGDWVSPEPQAPQESLNPVYHAWTHRLMAEMAAAMGREADAAHHRARFAAVRNAWRSAWLAVDGFCAKSDAQALYACAVRAGVMDPAEAGPHLVRCVERAGWHLGTGFLGTSCLLPALSDCGRDDVAWRVLTSTGYPSWLYTVKNGATTMWERWNTYSPETGPVNVGNMNSYNHYAFGAVGEWMHARIAGIDRAVDDVGCARLVFRPMPGGHCRRAAATWTTPRGRAAVAWHLDAAGFHLEATIPPNTTAEVHIPAPQGVATVTHDGARHLRDEAGRSIYAVGAGVWRFSAAR